MKYYVRDWGRPCGVEPKVFTSLEEAEVNCDYGGPSIEEFNSELEAWRFIKESKG